ncbi:MAG TPA: alanine racemase [Ornithinibacter sp.]|jgi:alanine racemase|uniref:alanine racemase n=1 Tax=Ornithinibacter sp. TaxID=2862748 RepID=UPI001B72D439|nr:alanine racemase [Ornithinibacter sp.]MBP6525322.1 alanine racemase [Dermatophilaceae bacterium]MBU9945165.1 alanine racemase [Dermatophilaceae bacterium]HNV40741.1 alanine racemase [Ornithinibacter sp.]HOT56805.1 alanine racemase [Ornithinibacter sp.]HPV90110.1 alanine racemase [Ornithinibacter sp.]
MTTPPAPVPAPAGASAWVSIDLDAIRDNVAELVRRAAPAQVLAVVKADAYGHGLVDSARAALAGGASWLGVAQLAEALRLREAGITAPLLTWLFAPGADIGGAIDADIEVTVGSMWSLDAVLAAVRERGAPARIQVKVDTGLGRGGILTDWPQMVARLAAAQAEGAVEVTGVWSHFAWADAPQHPTVRAQQVRFEEACDELARAGVRPPLRHLANSAATLTNPSAHFDLVRPGLAVYGLSPVPDLGDSAHFGLREAMRVTARLSVVKRAAAGQGVSYGHEYVTDRDTVLGLVPMGYADGIPRAAGGAGPMLVGDRRLTIAGRVCMDQVVLDLGPDFAGAAGDEVVVLGRAADGEPSAQDWAQAAGTINYEIVTRMSPRLPRVLLGGPF